MIEDVLGLQSNTQMEIAEACDSIKRLLLSKNKKYGDSALDPLRIFSKASSLEQIFVRIDDKLSRISRGRGLLGTDEDVLDDLIGYLVLAKIALAREAESKLDDSLTDSATRLTFLTDNADDNVCYFDR